MLISAVGDSSYSRNINGQEKSFLVIVYPSVSLLHVSCEEIRFLIL